MANNISIPTKRKGQKLTAPEFNELLNGTNNTIDEVNQHTEDITNLNNNKVDKETGKGLSTNDFTNTFKNKLTNLNELNKGFFVDESSIISAYPVGSAGFYCVNGETDTIWVWDVETNQWVDTGSKGGDTTITEVTWTEGETKPTIEADIIIGVINEGETKYVQYGSVGEQTIAILHSTNKTFTKVTQDIREISIDIELKFGTNSDDALFVTATDGSISKITVDSIETLVTIDQFTDTIRSFIYHDNQLIVIDYSDILYSVDVDTGIVTELTVLTNYLSSSNISGIDDCFAVSGDKLYMAVATDSSLAYSYNVLRVGLSTDTVTIIFQSNPTANSNYDDLIKNIRANDTHLYIPYSRYDGSTVSFNLVRINTVDDSVDSLFTPDLADLQGYECYITNITDHSVALQGVTEGPGIYMAIHSDGSTINMTDYISMNYGGEGGAHVIPVIMSNALVSESILVNAFWTTIESESVEFQLLSIDDSVISEINLDTNDIVLYIAKIDSNNYMLTTPLEDIFGTEPPESVSLVRVDDNFSSNVDEIITLPPNTENYSITTPYELYIPDDIVLTFNKMFGDFEIFGAFDPTILDYVDLANQISTELSVPTDDLRYNFGNDVIVIRDITTSAYQYHLFTYNDGVLANRNADVILPPDTTLNDHLMTLYYDQGNKRLMLLDGEIYSVEYDYTLVGITISNTITLTNASNWSYCIFIKYNDIRVMIYNTYSGYTAYIDLTTNTEVPITQEDSGELLGQLPAGDDSTYESICWSTMGNNQSQFAGILDVYSPAT